MGFTHFFVDRPIFASVCSILIVLIGQVGCITLVVILLSVWLGLRLDEHFGTRPLYTLILLFAGIPLSVWLMLVVARRTLKHGLWLVIAAATGGAWVFYFADAPTLAADLLAFQAPMVAYAFIGLLTFTTYWLGGHMREARDLALLIGGPDGFAPEVLARADYKWALSKLTFPHALVRVVLAEQIYRAYSLLNNHPYHRE